MNDILRFIFIILVTINLLFMQLDLSTKARTVKYLKEDLEIAVHDAALALDDDMFSRGYFVFDEDQARENFIESFELNTGIDSENYNIQLFKVFDQSNTEFPYEFEDQVTGFSDIILYPTVVAVVNTTVSNY